MKSNAIFTLTHPKGVERIYKAKDGSKGSHICIGDVGYISGSAWGLMALVLDGYTETENWFIVNLQDSRSTFLASVAVLGATSEEHAAHMALRTFNGDMCGIAQAREYETVSSPAFVLKRLLDSESRAEFKACITAAEINNLYKKITSIPVKWEGDQPVSHGSVTALVSDIMRYDEDRELQQVVSSEQAFAPLLEGSEMGQYDAIVTQVSRLDALSNRILVAMGKAADKVKPVAVEKTDPFKKHNVVNVAQHFKFDDGQAVIIVYHNPDSTPNKLDAKDLLTSWKFQLNGRDVTAALQPKSGKDVNIPEMAKRIMLLVESNSSRFVRSQERKIKAQKALDELNAIEAEKIALIEQLDKEIAELQAELDKPIGEYVEDAKQGIITGEKDKGTFEDGEKTYSRDENGDLLNHTGQPFKTRVVADKVIKKLGLAGYTVKVTSNGYVIHELVEDPTYKTNGYVTVGNANYKDQIVKAEPKLMFNIHGHDFLIVKSDVSTESNNIEVIELKGRASIPIQDEQGKDQFFFNSVSSAYAKILAVLAGMSADQFAKTALAKREEIDLVQNNLVAEGHLRQPADQLRHLKNQEYLDKAKNRMADLDKRRDENGRLNPQSEDPNERIQAYNEMSYQERLNDAEAATKFLNRDKELTAEELKAKTLEQRKKIIVSTAKLNDDPSYIEANIELYAVLNNEYLSQRDNTDSSLVESLKNKVQKQKAFLESKGVAINPPEDNNEPKKTRYEIKNANPRKRKREGLIILTERPDRMYDVKIELGTTGGEYVGDIEGTKRWLMGRMQSLGDAMGDTATTWENIAERLNLTLGDDVLNIGPSENISEIDQLPNGMTVADVERNENLKGIRDTLKTIAEENPGNVTFKGKSGFKKSIDAMLFVAESLAENPPPFVTANDVADQLQYQLNQTPKLRQYAVLMPKLDRVTEGKTANKLRRLDKAFKEAGLAIHLTGNNKDLLLSGAKAFPRIKIYYDPTMNGENYHIFEADKMYAKEYGELLPAIMDYLNDDNSHAGKVVYLGRNGKIIDTATNQLGYELKAKFNELDAKQVQEKQDFKSERNERVGKLKAAIKEGKDLLASFTDDELESLKHKYFASLPVADIRSNATFKIESPKEGDRDRMVERLQTMRNELDSKDKGPNITEIREQGLAALAKVKKFLSSQQYSTIEGLIKRGEESQFYADKMMEMEKRIDAMPVTYQTDGQGKKALAVLHYFTSNMDWYITEKDVDGGVIQAYGYVENGYGLEGGYINIQEIASVNAELDLHFSPTSIHTIEGTQPDQSEAEDNSIMDNQADAEYLDKILTGDINPADLDMKDLEAMAIKYGEDQDAEIYVKLEKAVGIAISAKIEKAKATK